MYDTQLKKVGGSVMMVIPPALLQLLDLKVNTTVSLDVENGRLLVVPKQEQRGYRLQDLVEQCDLSAPLPMRDEAWERVPAVGSELPW